MARRTARVSALTPATQRAGEPHPASGKPSVEVEIRDQYQLELRFNHTLQRGDEEQHYRLESFIFIPRNVGVNRPNYPRETLYSDATALMRLDATPLGMEELVKTSCTSSPLHALSAAAERFRAEGRPPPSAHLRERIDAAFGQKAHAMDEPTIEATFAEALGRLREGLWAFRRLRNEFLPFELRAHVSFAETMRMADE